MQFIITDELKTHVVGHLVEKNVNFVIIIINMKENVEHMFKHALGKYFAIAMSIVILLIIVMHMDNMIAAAQIVFKPLFQVQNSVISTHFYNNNLMMLLMILKKMFNTDVIKHGSEEALMEILEIEMQTKLLRMILNSLMLTTIMRTMLFGKQQLQEHFYMVIITLYIHVDMLYMKHPYGDQRVLHALLKYMKKLSKVFLLVRDHHIYGLTVHAAYHII